MTDLEILAKFRQAEAAGTVHKFTKSTHDCVNSNCDNCIARTACRAVVDSDSANDFDANYRDWAKRTKLLALSDLRRNYPEYFI